METPNKVFNLSVERFVFFLKKKRRTRRDRSRQLIDRFKIMFFLEGNLESQIYVIASIMFFCLHGQRTGDQLLIKQRFGPGDITNEAS